MSTKHWRISQIKTTTTLLRDVCKTEVRVLTARGLGSARTIASIKLSHSTPLVFVRKTKGTIQPAGVSLVHQRTPLRAQPLVTCAPMVCVVLHLQLHQATPETQATPVTLEIQAIRATQVIQAPPHLATP